MVLNAWRRYSSISDERIAQLFRDLAETTERLASGESA
jgi:hypothetical protein